MRSESLKQSLDAVRSLTEFAYEQGYHEVGYDPVESLIAAVRQAAFEEARKAVEEVKRGSPSGKGTLQGHWHERGVTDALAALDALATPPDTGTP